MLKRLMDEAQRSHAIIVHAKTVEIERLTEEFQSLRMVIGFSHFISKNLNLIILLLFFNSLTFVLRCTLRMFYARPGFRGPTQVLDPVDFTSRLLTFFFNFFNKNLFTWKFLFLSLETK